ncbi:chalcone-flavanone isomerase [Xylariaceae sp. FL0804]|nr:chalcone-flavanone isomerase [Xylariaceae sp. FL0804]
MSAPLLRSSAARPLLRSVAAAPRLPRAPSHAAACLRAGAPLPQCRTLFMRTARPSFRAQEGLNVRRIRKEVREYHLKRQLFLLCGAISGVIASCYTGYLLYQASTKPARLDAGPLPPDKIDPFNTEAGSRRKVVVHDADGREVVPTGHANVPTFPRVLKVDVGVEDGREAIHEGVEYTLVGLGLRTVTFLGFHVYVVGWYVATADVAAIQARLVREINPIATTLVPSEKAELRAALLDPERGERLWASIVGELRPRSLFRIEPTRATDFGHLRDGLVRAITARSQGRAAEYGDDAFGRAMQDFRQMFSGRKVPANTEMLLCRDAAGALTVLYSEGKGGGDKEAAARPQTVGRVEDERVSRLLWLNYLAGKQVASEEARKNIVDGIMEFVERPIGTVATQVV